MTEIWKHGLSGYIKHKCRCDICKAARKESDARYRAKNPQKIKEAGLKQRQGGEYWRRHGLTLEELTAMLDTQSWQCIIPSCSFKFSSLDEACVDHDHLCCAKERGCTKCIRGIICGHCNKALGFARDTPALLRDLADYLEQFQILRA